MLLYLCQFSYYASAANGSSDSYTYWRSYIILNTLSMVFLILFAPNTTMSLVVMPVKYIRVNVLCSYRRDISLCVILSHSITLKDLEHS